MKINLNEITIIKQPDEGVLAKYKDCTVSVSLYRTYALNCQEAVRQLKLVLNPDMKILNKENFMAAVAAFVEGQGTHKEEYWTSPANLAEEFLIEFYNEYFEIDPAKDARRAEYLKLKLEFGNE